MRKPHSRIVKIFAFTAVALVLLLVAGMVKAGSLTPSASPAATMRTLQEIYDSIASTTFDSSSISASSTGSLIQHLKYITNNLFWASSTGNIYYNGGGRVGIGTSTPAGILHVATGTTDGLFVSNNGFVGIGTTTPAYKFKVIGLANISTSSESTLVLYQYSTATGSLTNANSVGWGGSLRLQKSLNNSDGTNTSTTHGTILGTLWFGGVNNNNFSDVGAGIAAIQNGSVGTTVIPADLVFLTGTTASNPLERMRITSIGSVGIGTTTPQYTLDVRGSFGVSGTSTLATTTITNLIVSGTSTLGTSTVTGNINLITGSSLLTGGTTRLDSIGQGTFTTTTITSLTVSGTSTFSGVISAPSGTLSNFTLGSLLFAGTGGALSQNNANLFWDNTNARLGIGTTTPPATLTVVAAIPSLSLVDTTSNNNKWYSIRLGSTTANAFDIFDNSSSTSRIVIDGAGNIGIGTTTPSSLLDVPGTVQLRGFSTGTLGLYVDGSGRVGIGNITPTSTLSITGSSTIENAFTINQGRIYQSGGILLNSNASSSNFTAGYRAGNALLSDGIQNTAIGYQALLIATSSDSNTAVGYQALVVNTSGSNNTAIGRSSLAANTTGIQNTAVGNLTLSDNTSGGQNIAIGNEALPNQTTAAGNIGIGYQTLFFNDTGGANTVIGYQAMFGSSGHSPSNNTAIGYRALMNTSSTYNVAVGEAAMRYNTIGNTNTAIGINAGVGLGSINFANITGDKNVFVGANSGQGVASSTGLTNAIAIGYQALVSASNTLVLGGVGPDAVNVAIGSTTAPTLLTLFSSSTAPAITLSFSTTTGREYLIRNGSVTSTMFDIYDNTSSTSRLVIDKNGNIGIGTTTPAYRLVVGDRVTQSDVTIPYGALCVDDLTGSGCPASPVAGTVYASTTAISAIDVAENYPTSDPTLAPGELVSLVTNDSEPLTSDSSGSNVTGQLSQVVGLIERASSHSRGRLVGVISTAPGVLLGRNIGNGFDPSTEFGAGELTVNRPVALAGRVPVKVSSENGAIAIGDPITASSRPGVGMKATETGKIVGYALENFSKSQIANSESSDTEQEGVIMVMIAQNELYVANEPTVTFESNLLPFSAEQMLAAVVEALKSLGVTIKDGIVRATEFIAEKITAKRVVTEELELKDSATGEIYCVRITNGEWEKTAGGCGDSSDSPVADTTPTGSDSTSTDSDFIAPDTDPTFDASITEGGTIADNATPAPKETIPESGSSQNVLVEPSGSEASEPAQTEDATPASVPTEENIPSTTE